MHSDAGDAPQRAPGSPIRTPPDQRSVDSSPGPIAASHVLHRLLVPRHPPCALDHLHTHPRQPQHTDWRPRGDNVRHHQGTTTETRPTEAPRTPMNQKSTLKTTRPPPTREGTTPSGLDARIHYPVHKHPTEPQTPTETHRTRPASAVCVSGLDPEPKKPASRLPLQDPIACHQTTRRTGRPERSSMFPPMSSATTRSVV